MTEVTREQAYTDKVTRTERREDYETKTRDVPHIKCDCCEQEWEKDGDVRTHSLAVNPGGNVRLSGLQELNEMVTPYQIDTSIRSVKNSYHFEGRELPDIGTAINSERHQITDSESSLGKNRWEPPRSGGGTQDERTRLMRDFQSQFPNGGCTGSRLWAYFYQVDLPEPDNEKHLCEFCYEAIF